MKVASALKERGDKPRPLPEAEDRPQVPYQDAMRHLKRPVKGWEVTTRGSATQPDQKREAELLKWSVLLPQVMRESLTPEDREMMWIHYYGFGDYRGGNISETVRLLRMRGLKMSRPTFYKRHPAALLAMGATLRGMGYDETERAAVLAAFNPRQPGGRHVRVHDAGDNLYNFHSFREGTMTDPFRRKKSDPPAIKLLKAIFRAGEKRDRELLAAAAEAKPTDEESKRHRG